MQGVHRPPFLLPPCPHLSFLLGPSSVAQKFQSWRLTLTIHTQPTQPIVVHTEKQFKQKKWLLLWMQHHREQKLTQKTLLLTTLFLYGIEVCLSALLSHQWPMSPSGAARSAVPMYPLMEHSFWPMLMLHLSCCHAHQDGQAKTDSLSQIPLLSCGCGRYTPGNGASCLSLVPPLSPRSSPMTRAGAASAEPWLPCSWPGRWDGPCHVLHPSTPRSHECSWIPALRPSASPKQTTIGSHCQLPCSVTANSSSFLFLLSYLLYIYTISFWGFFIPLTYHYSLFSSVPLKEHINTPAYSVSCPCHQINIWENTCPFLFALWSNCQEKKDFFKNTDSATTHS